jgi:CRP/FNR family transcriptional regulator
MTAKPGRDLTLYRMKPSESCILTTSALINKESYYAQGVTKSVVTAIALSSEAFNKAIQCSVLFAHYVLKSDTSR